MTRNWRDDQTKPCFIYWMLPLSYVLTLEWIKEIKFICKIALSNTSIDSNHENTRVCSVLKESMLREHIAFMLNIDFFWFKRKNK